MTNMPEVKLAREAELCYGTLALVTDYDVWHDTHEHVSVEGVVQNLQRNVATAREVVERVVTLLPPTRSCGCPGLLRNAVITDPRVFPAATRKRLDLLIGKYFPAPGRASSRRGGAGPSGPGVARPGAPRRARPPRG
jgi:5'-methylthioadenosine phosphorylase